MIANPHYGTALLETNADIHAEFLELNKPPAANSTRFIDQKSITALLLVCPVE